MNKQSLYMVGGAALLASTALSSNAHAAATLKSWVNSAAGAPASGSSNGTITTWSAAPLATQMFPTTTTSANNVTISGTVTASGGLLIDIGPTFANFDLKLDIDTTTAAFVNSVVPTVTFYTQSTTGTLDSLLTSVLGCNIQPSAERLNVLSCQPNGASSRVDAILVMGLAYQSAAALRTPSTSITISGATYFAGQAGTIDALAPTAVVTSKSVVAFATVETGSTATIDNNSTTPFTVLVSTGTSTSTTAVLGSVQFSLSAAVSTDLSHTFTALASVISTAEVRVTHSALTDSALSKLSFNGTNLVSSQFQTNTATFTVGAASLVNTNITATFYGTSAISASTGTLSATVTPLNVASITVGPLVTTVPAFSGTLATLQRGGLSVELNTVLPSAMKASYISFLRIANQSSVASTATITVKNDSDGTTVGSFATASIPSGATLSVNSVDIDAGLTAAGKTPLTNASYKVTVTGSFNGYVQNLLFNVANSSFADASGFRNGALTGDP